MPPSFFRHFNWTLAFTIIGLSTIAAGVFVFNRCASLPGRTTKETVDQMERVGRDLRDAIVQITQLQPRVTINNRVYFEQTSSIAELALISKRSKSSTNFFTPGPEAPNACVCTARTPPKPASICARNSVSRLRRKRLLFVCRTHKFWASNKTLLNFGLREWILESHFWRRCASGAGFSCQTRARSRRCAESSGRSRRVVPDTIESPYWRYPASAGDFLPNAEVRLMRLSAGAVAR